MNMTFIVLLILMIMMIMTMSIDNANNIHDTQFNDLRVADRPGPYDIQYCFASTYP